MTPFRYHLLRHCPEFHHQDRQPVSSRITLAMPMMDVVDLAFNPWTWGSCRLLCHRPDLIDAGRYCRAPGPSLVAHSLAVKVDELAVDGERQKLPALALKADADVVVPSTCIRKIRYVSFINLTTILASVGCLRSIAFCIFSAALLISSFANGATIPVSSNLQAAIDAASPGDTLQVAMGVYDKITIQKSLNLVGNGAVIRAGNRDACVNIDADNVRISGFTVRDGFYGIKLNSVSGCNVSNNTVIYCAQPGIALIFSDGNTITGNNASFNGIVGEGWYGIYLSNSNDNLITNNVAYGNGAYGINLFPSCRNNTISGNVLQGNMYGLYMFTDCANNLIEKNDLSRNTNSGLDLRINCTGNLIINNTMEDNVVAGLTLMEESGQNTISGNVIRGNGRYGLQIQSRSDGNTIIYNNISDSQTGIFLESSKNVIHGNRIADNVIQADDRGMNRWNAQYPKGGNLWSDYRARMRCKDPGKKSLARTALGISPT